MKYVNFFLLLVLVILYSCQDKQVKEIEVKYNDRSEFIQNVENETADIPNDPKNPNIEKLKDKVALLTNELRLVNSENRECQITRNSQATEITENRKRLKEAEWSMGFVSAFKWTGIITVILIVLGLAWRISKFFRPVVG